VYLFHHIASNFLLRVSHSHISVIELTEVKLTMVNSQERDQARERILGKATGDTLKAIHALETIETPALPSAIATRTGTSRAFVTKMLKDMHGRGLVEYAPYQGVRLTAPGRQNALELSRHHRLLERFLTDCLGFTADGAHIEAERLEHVISEEFEERLDAFLNHPTTCPHGKPIPSIAAIASSEELKRL
jgi:DtxR family transcriptional regulator, Mn-dependent transcriptional regulator